MEQKESDYDKYLKVIIDTQNTLDESWRYVEKRFYAIASGALALSITLISTTISTTHDIHSKWLIITSWILLTLSIIINLVSHIISYQSSDKTIKDLHDKIKKNEPFDTDKINEMINKYNDRISLFNLASIFCLILGIIVMIAFFIYQIKFY